MKVLILGATGMLGNAMMRVFSQNPELTVYGTVRHEGAKKFFSEGLSKTIITNIDVENVDSLLNAFSTARPDLVVNCIGLVKQLADASNPLIAVPINTLLPHRLATLCGATGARLVHISTDCVFSGKKGNYLESDFPDAYDLYGRSKLLGEVDYPHAVTLRTSIIGHELSGNRSLLNWFLSQEDSVQGYTKAIFSGLPTVELATIVRDQILPRNELRGLYHVSSDPINKFDLLVLIAKAYGKSINIHPSDTLVIDRSLNSERFQTATGYTPPAWPDLIQKMVAFK